MVSPQESGAQWTASPSPGWRAPRCGRDSKPARMSHNQLGFVPGTCCAGPDQGSATGAAGQGDTQDRHAHWQPTPSAVCAPGPRSLMGPEPPAPAGTGHRAALQLCPPSAPGPGSNGTFVPAALEPGGTVLSEGALPDRRGNERKSLRAPSSRARAPRQARVPDTLQAAGSPSGRSWESQGPSPSRGTARAREVRGLPAPRTDHSGGQDPLLSLPPPRPATSAEAPAGLR